MANMSVVSIGSRLGISRSLAIVVTIVVSIIWVTIRSMMAIAEMVSISIVTIEGTGISFGLSISRPFAIVMTIVVNIVWVSMESMVSISKVSIAIVTIECTSISSSLSCCFTSNSSKQTQGNNSLGRKKILR